MKRIIAILLTAVMVLSTLSAVAFGATLDGNTTNGTYNLMYWSYNKDTKTFTYGGVGNIPTANSVNMPFYDFLLEAEHIELRDGVTGIDKSGFKNCVNLKTVTFPDSLTSFGDYAFAGCTALESIEVPQTVTSIGTGAFSGCTALCSAIINANITMLPWMMFSGCSALEYVELSESILAFDAACFDRCTSLKQFEIPEGTTTIEYSIFGNCTALETLSLPKSLTSIACSQFENCTSLKKINYAGTFEQWEQITFTYTAYSKTGLDRINNTPLYCDYENSYPVADGNVKASGTTGTLSWSISDTGKFKVSGNGDLPEIYVNEFYIQKSLQLNCKWNTYLNDVQSIEVANGVTSLGKDSLLYMKNAKKAYIPDSVTKIGEEAFIGCLELRFVYIGSGVKEIGKWAFSGGNKLRTIIYNGTQSEWNAITKGADIFDEDATVSVVCLKQDLDGVVKTTPSPKPTPTPNDDKTDTKQTENKESEADNTQGKTSPKTGFDYKVILVIMAVALAVAVTAKKKIR